MSDGAWVGYVRVSSDDQVREATPENQRRSIEEMAKALGGERAGVFEDLAVSGATSFTERPGWMALERRVAVGDVREIRVFDATRLTRQEGLENAARLEGLMRRFDIRVVTKLNGAFTLKDWAQLLTLVLVLVMGAAERKRILESTSAGKVAKAAAGHPIGGPPPFGLTWSRTAGWAAHPVHGPVVKRIFELSASGMSLSEVSQAMDLEGSKPPSAASWQPTWVARILKRDCYRGRYRQKYRGQVIDATIPPLVDEDLFQRVQAGLRARRNLPMRANDISFLLRHCLECRDCGAKLWAQPAWGTAPGRYYCKRCSSSGGGSPYWRRDVIDDRVWAVLSDGLMNSDALLERVVADRGGDEALLETTAAEGRAAADLARVEKARQATRRRALSGMLDEDEADRDLANLARQREQAEATLDRARRSRQASEAARAHRGTAAAEVFKLRQRIDGADAAQKRAIVLAMVPPGIGKIVVHKDGRLDIHGVLPTVVEPSLACPVP